MSERGPIRTEAAGAERQPASGGERLIVGLAVLALLAGLWIAVGNLLDGDQSADASIAPGATAAASAIARSTVSPSVPGELLVVPGDPEPSGDPVAPAALLYVRALDALPIRADPVPEGDLRGTVEPGRTVVVLDGDGPEARDGWLRIFDPRPLGWIQVRDARGELAELYPFSGPPPRLPDRGEEVIRPGLHVLLGGDSGFMAVRARDDGTLELVTSADGRRWSGTASSDVASLINQSAIAWGPAGWLSVGDRVSRSDDGSSWTDLGTLGENRLYPEQFGGSSLGYLIKTSVAQPDSPEPAVSWWFSSNGLLWSELPNWGLPWYAEVGIAGSGSGFYAWNRSASDLREPGMAGAFTPDGRAWQVLADGPVGSAATVVFVGDRILGADQDPASGAIRVWRGAVEGGRLAWELPRQQPAVFGSDALALLAGDGQRAVVVSWNRGGEDVRSHVSTDGVSWAPIQAPDGGWSVIPHWAVGSPAGILVADAIHDPVDPRIWRLGDTGWETVRAAALADPPAPAPGCPPPPRDGLDFVLLDPALGQQCFGDAPLTFRAYSIRCRACDGRRSATPWEPAWLAPDADWYSPFGPSGLTPRAGLYLSPYQTYATGLPATTLGPELGYSESWADAWVEVVGHFDDPAAQDCRELLDEAAEARYSGRAASIAGCRQRFVVTQVTVVDGP
jgi:hypothetical protein